MSETCVISHANTDAIEALPSLPPNDRPSFIYVDLPMGDALRLGQRGICAYYVL